MIYQRCKGSYIDYFTEKNMTTLNLLEEIKKNAGVERLDEFSATTFKGSGDDALITISKVIKNGGGTKKIVASIDAGQYSPKNWKAQIEELNKAYVKASEKGTNKNSKDYATYYPRAKQIIQLWNKKYGLNQQEKVMGNNKQFDKSTFAK